MIVRSPFPDVTIPEVPLTAYVLQHTARLAAKPAPWQSHPAHQVCSSRLPGMPAAFAV